jgi:hypothetical protein
MQRSRRCEAPSGAVDRGAWTRVSDHAASPAALAAIFRKHSRHRQSSPSIGIGSRAVSSAHQHGPAGLQVNSAPQAEQSRRRDAGFSNRFVIN